MGEEVTQTLGHLLVVHAHETVVHPVIDKGALMRALAQAISFSWCGNCRSRATAVIISNWAPSNSELIAEHSVMPAGRATQAGPLDLLRLSAGVLHGTKEIQRVMLAARHLDIPLTRAQLVRTCRQLAVAELAHHTSKHLRYRPCRRAVVHQAPISFTIGATYSVARGS